MFLSILNYVYSEFTCYVVDISKCLHSIKCRYIHKFSTTYTLLVSRLLRTYLLYSGTKLIISYTLFGSTIFLSKYQLFLSWSLISRLFQFYNTCSMNSTYLSILGRLTLRTYLIKSIVQLVLEIEILNKFLNSIHAACGVN